MKKHITLSSMNPGEYAVITGIDLQGSMRRRIRDLGLTEGTCVKCIQKAGHGTPVAYCIRGAVIALRKNDADRINAVLCIGG